MEDSCLDGKCIPANHGSSACQIVDEGKDLQIVTVVIVWDSWRGDDGVRACVFGGDYRKRLTCLDMLHSALDLDGFFEME